MKSRSFTILTGIILSSLFVFSALQLEKQRETILSSSFVEYTMPSKIIGPASLEFKGLASDFLLFKFMTFMGGKVAFKNVISETQWEHLTRTLDTITDLDPYFWDAYLFSEVFLAWDAKRYEDANRLLLKGAKYLTDNYRIFYYLGFNYFYFLKDNENGRKYLMEAAKRPECNSYVANLAARLSVYSFKHQDGIAFLKEMLKETRDKTTYNMFKKRIQTLEKMAFLEEKITEYKKMYSRYPSTLDDILQSGLISTIPKDPYGGQFVIMPNGRIYTTSNMVDKKEPQKKE